MKKTLLVLCASACVFQNWGQGTLQITPGASIKTSGDAYLFLDNMHIVNDGSLQQNAGNGFVKLAGGLNVDLSGSSATIINQLLLAKTGSSTLNLQSNIAVVSNVNFSGGLLNLNNQVLDLGSTGIFTDESEASRAYTIGLGYAQATGILNSPSSANLGQLGAVITSTKNLGSTIIKRGHKEQTGISGSNNSILRYYDITPTNNMALKATLRFYYFDAELNSIPEATLYQWKSNNNINWDLVGADARNATDNYVERNNISKFDRWTLATATPPTIACPSNMTVSANMPGCKASVSFAATATGIPTPTITYRIGNTVITSPHVFSRGTTTVTATASNDVLPNATCNFTVTVVCGPSPSITNTTEPPKELKAISSGLDVIAYPNPASSYFNIAINSSNIKEKIELQVFDQYGRLVERRMNISNGSAVRLGDRYGPGVYYVRVIQSKQHKEMKLIKVSD